MKTYNENGNITNITVMQKINNFANLAKFNPEFVHFKISLTSFLFWKNLTIIKIANITPTNDQITIHNVYNKIVSHVKDKAV